jgi:RimJ/RimL family protein N-acetyltransferase
MLETLELSLIEAAFRRDDREIEALGYKTNGEWPGPDFFEALPYFRDLLIQNNGTKGFDSWIMVEKDSREIVGGIGFLGNPDANGIVEIGFATNESHRRKGYCLEAARTLIEWALSHNEVQSVTAKCEPDNTGSKKVLLKLGFRLNRQDEELLHWSYEEPTKSR